MATPYLGWCGNAISPSSHIRLHLFKRMNDLALLRWGTVHLAGQLTNHPWLIISVVYRFHGCVICILVLELQIDIGKQVWHACILRESSNDSNNSEMLHIMVECNL